MNTPCTIGLYSTPATLGEWQQSHKQTKPRPTFANANVADLQERIASAKTDTRQAKVMLRKYDLMDSEA